MKGITGVQKKVQKGTLRETTTGVGAPLWGKGVEK